MKRFLQRTLSAAVSRFGSSSNLVAQTNTTEMTEVSPSTTARSEEAVPKKVAREVDGRKRARGNPPPPVAPDSE
jgi:hypothetical protein